MFISPELKTSKKNNCMTSSIMLQTTGLIDTQINNNNNNNSNNTTISTENQMMNTSNIYGKTFAGLHPERSIVFTCLEIVVCIVARYQPQIIKQLRLSNTDSNNNSNNESKSKFWGFYLINVF
ncbi:unnamed protein product [Trichobilharzia regenti]|nr:unnamed protein product [Trichobilharzia regenti]